MKKIILIFAVIIFAVIGYAGICGATCDKPAAPVLNVNLSGTYLQLSWNAVQGANGYRLYYTFYPERELWHSADIGNMLFTGVELWPGAAFYALIRAYNDCGESDNVFAEYFIVDTDLHYGLAHGNGQAIIEVQAYGMWCNDIGNISPLPDGTVLYLHSHLKDRDVGVCNNVLAAGVVINGWVKFIYDNPAEFINPLITSSSSYILDKHWITTQYCTGGDSECHLWIPAKARNALYVLNCDGNPELAVVYYKDKMTPVPPGTPCTVVGVECLP